MTGIFDLYANDELQVLKEERMCQLQAHRKARGPRLSREAWTRQRDDIVGEISLINDEIEFRTLIGRSRNARSDLLAD